MNMSLRYLGKWIGKGRKEGCTTDFLYPKLHLCFITRDPCGLVNVNHLPGYFQTSLFAWWVLNNSPGYSLTIVEILDRFWTLKPSHFRTAIRTIGHPAWFLGLIILLWIKNLVKHYILPFIYFLKILGGFVQGGRLHFFILGYSKFITR